MFTKSNRILARCRFHFSQFFIVNEVSSVRQAEIHTAEPILNEPSAFEVGIIILNLKRHKSQVTVPMPAELIKAGGTKIRSETRKFINSKWNKEEMPE